MKDIFDPNLLNELLDAAHNPPGGDPTLGAFYTAVVELVEDNKPIAKILMEVKRKRPEITYKHLTNLLFRVYQAIKFREKDLSYRNLTNIYKWREELTRICSNTKPAKQLKKLLNTKSTTTTIYQRYIGPFALVHHVCNSKAVTVADLGCGGNYGLRGMELAEPFKPVKDLTPKKRFTQMLQQKINFKKGLAIDKENPDEKAVKAWRLACSFYPQELGSLAAIEEFENRIKDSRKVDFLQADLLSLKKLPKKSYHAVILSSILYQLNLSDQLSILSQAKKLLAANGIIIVQDFAAKSLANPGHLDFNESWFGKNYSYRTFIAGEQTDWKFLEVFQWNNGRCQVVRAGEDFNRIFPKLQS